MKTAPDPIDVQDFQFKQSNISQIFDVYHSIPNACNLLATDKKRGLIYAAQNNKVIILKPGSDSDPEWKIELHVSVVVSKLALNCDCSYLAVAPHEPLILIYDAQLLTKNNVQLLYDIRISTSDANVFVNDLRWNPAMPGMLCTIASDHTIGSFKIKDKKEKTIESKDNYTLEKFNNVDAMCAAWSPKGKQIVVGCRNGSLVQFKPDLKVARTIPGPTSYIGEIVSILWISSYQFCAAYLDSEKHINVLIVDAPKGETNAIFTCYEDITYGLTETAEEGMIPCYYFDHVPEWGIIIAASSNSSDVAVLGSSNGGTWNLWQLIDSGRAELPLICTIESYPVGLAIDKSSTRRLPWGTDFALPHPVPILHILSTSGQLCSFHMVNLTPNCPSINLPPTEIVTPPPEARSNVVSETPLLMNGAITSTPRIKQSENIPDRTKPIPSGNIFNKFGEGNSFFTQSPPEKPKQQEQKPESTSTVMKVEQTRDAEPQDNTTQQEVKQTSTKETVIQVPVQKKPRLVDYSKDYRAYLEEHYLFEKELRNRLEPETLECGTEEERRKLIDQSFEMDQFLRQLREATNSLSSDIACLKALLLQSFAWTEETKSKNAATNDITTRDCEDNNKIADLQKLYYYTQTQLSQVSKILDLEWSNHASQEMSRMKIPHLEYVYQNMILHNEIIQEEKTKVEDLKEQWKLVTRKISLSNLNVTSSKSSTIPRKYAAIIEARCKAISSKALSFTPEKETKLREHLSISAPKVIKPVNPSPIQHRLEATLSSLAIRDNTCTEETKSKAEETVAKQMHASKQEAVEKPELQSPLAFLDSIVARIGTNDANNISMQNKMQSKQSNFDISIPSVAASKVTEVEKKHNIEPMAAVPQSTQLKQDTITFNQVPALTNTLTNLLKSFPIANANTCESPIQKPDDTTVQKTVPKKSSANSGKEATLSTESSKLESNIFGTSSLQDALTSDTSGEKTSTINANTGLNFGMKVPTTTKSEAMSTFSFATPTIPLPAKTVQSTFVAPPTSAEAFSFSLKSTSTSTPFSLRIPSSTTIITATTTTTTTTQTQDALNFTDSKYSYKSTFGTPDFQILLDQQNTVNGNESSIGVAKEAPSKDTVSTTPLVTIEKVIPMETKALNLQTSTAQDVPASSATPLFNTQMNTSNATLGGEMSSLASTMLTFTVTTSIPTAQTTTSSASIFSGFNYNFPTTNTTSSLKTSPPKNTFGESATNLTSSINPATTTSSTLTFGSSTTTSTPLIFAKPSLTMNTQFEQTTPPVSSTASTFGEPIRSPTSMGFASTTNSSVFESLPATSTTVSIFSGSSSNSIFGGNTQVSSGGSIYGGNTDSMNTFKTPEKSAFDNSDATSKVFYPFDNTANTTLPGFPSPASAPVFNAAAANVSPTGVEQPTFGQATTKPIFGSPPSFGAPKPIFGGFGSAAFGAAPAAPAFGSPPEMGGTPAPIDTDALKVFGNIGGSSTFESLASQPSELSFSSLAQNSAEPPKAPVFTTSSSFSTWR